MADDWHDQGCGTVQVPEIVCENMLFSPNGLLSEERNLPVPVLEQSNESSERKSQRLKTIKRSSDPVIQQIFPKKKLRVVEFQLAQDVDSPKQTEIPEPTLKARAKSSECDSQRPETFRKQSGPITRRSVRLNRRQI